MSNAPAHQYDIRWRSTLTIDFGHENREVQLDMMSIGRSEISVGPKNTSECLEGGVQGGGK